MFRSTCILILALSLSIPAFADESAEPAPIVEAESVAKPDSTGAESPADAAPAEATAEPAAEAEQAGPADSATLDDLWSPTGEVSLTYDDIFMEDSGRTIAEEIQIELLDVDSIMRAFDESRRERLVRLSLEDCIQLALSQNPDIQIAAIEPLMAESDIKAAKGEFDPIAQLTGNYNVAEVSLSAQQVVFGGIDAIRSYTTNLNAQLGGKLHTGTQWGIVGTMEKSEDTFNQFIEEFNTQVALTLTQPVLRGFGLKYNRVRITAAQNNRALTEAQLLLTAMNTVAEVIKAYWDLVGAVEAVQLNRASLDNANRLLQVNETRREIGTAADIEVLSAKTGVATRQSDLISARSLVGDASDRLKQLMNLREGEMFSRLLVVPVDRPNVSDEMNFDPEAYDASIEASIAKALENRPELDIADLQLANAQLDEYRAQRDMMPQLDLTGSYAQGGRDHKVRETLYAVRDGDDTVYSVGFQAAVPLGNRAARGQYQRSKLTRRQAELQGERAKTDVMMLVHTAARNVLKNQTLVESNQQAVRLKQAEVAAEESRLRLGVTTSWQVLQVQEQLTAAETALLQSQIAYEKALIDLQTAEGSLLQKLEITVAPPEEEGLDVGYFESIRPRWN
ncbi:MAG: hypothetical protein RLZZ303_1660 [Candidatus Hydrogenedentota bacterium]|jgi:outer membrane protein TolC